MAAPEVRSSGWEKAKSIVRASSLALTLGVAACSSPSTETQPATASTADSSTERAPAPTIPEDKIWGNALLELRGKVERGEAVTLLVPDRPLCIYWPASIRGAYTVQRNPVMYAYKEGDTSLSFFPFVSHKKDMPPSLMNGPYQSQRLDRNSRPIPGSEVAYGEVIIPQDEAFLFLSKEVHVSLEQELPADVFTSAWMLGDDGTRYAETKVVLEEDLATAFPDCTITPPSELDEPGVQHI